MRTRVVVIGGDLRDPLCVLAAEYLKRSGRRLDAGLVPLKPGRRAKGADDAKICAAEGEALLQASEGCTRIALDERGKIMNSEDFSTALEGWMARGRPLAFLLGGATGLSENVRQRSDVVWSLSPLTFPHRLALCVLAEKIYRASEIIRGGPYHKA